MACVLYKKAKLIISNSLLLYNLHAVIELFKLLTELNIICSLLRGKFFLNLNLMILINWFWPFITRFRSLDIYLDTLFSITVFSSKSDSTITNVCRFFCLSSKPLFILYFPFFILPQFIILHPSFLFHPT